MQEVRTLVVTCIVEEVRLTVVEGLCHTAIFRVVGA